MFRPADGHHQVGVQTEHIKEKFTSERDFFCAEVRYHGHQFVLKQAMRAQTGLFPGGGRGSGRGVALTTHFHLAQTLKKE